MIGDFIARKHGTQKIVLCPSISLTDSAGDLRRHRVPGTGDEDLQRGGGFSLAKADVMRRAMGKKDKNLMAAMKKEFVDGAVAAGS